MICEPSSGPSLLRFLVVKRVSIYLQKHWELYIIVIYIIYKCTNNKGKKLYSNISYYVQMYAGKHSNVKIMSDERKFIVNIVRIVKFKNLRSDVLTVTFKLKFMFETSYVSMLEHNENNRT